MRMILFTIIAAFGLDQLSKWAALWAFMQASEQPIIVMPGVFQLQLGWNYGINFGLFAHDHSITRWGLIALSIMISIWFFRWAQRTPDLISKICIGTLIGGALGNAFDRALHGAVVDFLNVSCCGIINPYVFNIADIFIFIGAIGLMLRPQR